MALGDSQAVDDPRITNSPASLPRVKGRVLQLEWPPVPHYPYKPWHFAQHLGAAWTLHGDVVLIARCALARVPDGHAIPSGRDQALRQL